MRWDTFLLFIPYPKYKYWAVARQLDVSQSTTWQVLKNEYLHSCVKKFQELTLMDYPCRVEFFFNNGWTLAFRHLLLDCPETVCHFIMGVPKRRPTLSPMKGRKWHPRLTRALRCGRHLLYQLRQRGRVELACWFLHRFGGSCAFLFMDECIYTSECALFSINVWAGIIGGCLLKFYNSSFWNKCMKRIIFLTIRGEWQFVHFSYFSEIIYPKFFWTFVWCYWWIFDYFWVTILKTHSVTYFILEGLVSR